MQSAKYEEQRAKRSKGRRTKHGTKNQEPLSTEFRRSEGGAASNYNTLKAFMDQSKANRFTTYSPRGILQFFWTFLLLGFLLFPFLTNAGNTGFVTCRFHELTGLSCPTCGMSRSLYELVHFHLLGSFKMHLFGPVVYLLSLVLFLKLSIEIVSGTTLKIGIAPQKIKKAFFTLATLWILFWLVRMGVEIIK